MQILKAFISYSPQQFSAEELECRGVGCGYIGVPREHPWYSIPLHYAYKSDIKVHGGITYSRYYLGNKCSIKDYWWIGFDTGHGNDTPQNCPIEYIVEQIDLLYDQAVKVYEDHISNITINHNTNEIIGIDA